MSRFSRSDVVTLELIVVRHSDKAVLVKETEFSKPVWLPKSQIEVDPHATGVVSIDMPERLATEKGLT